MQTNPDVPTADLQTMCGPRDHRFGTTVRAAEPPFFRPTGDGRPPTDQVLDRQDDRDADDEAEHWDAERWDGLA